MMVVQAFSGWLENAESLKRTLFYRVVTLKIGPSWWKAIGPPVDPPSVNSEKTKRKTIASWWPKIIKIIIITI